VWDFCAQQLLSSKKNERLGGSRHSDKEKFPSGLNHPQGRKMPEWLLNALRKFTTSKLNTRVRFPSPAPMFSGAFPANRFSF
jgi:hypothetical protein